jgi:hypothetical protein
MSPIEKKQPARQTVGNGDEAEPSSGDDEQRGDGRGGGEPQQNGASRPAPSFTAPACERNAECGQAEDGEEHAAQFPTAETAARDVR